MAGQVSQASLGGSKRTTVMAPISSTTLEGCPSLSFKSFNFCQCSSGEAECVAGVGRRGKRGGGDHQGPQTMQGPPRSPRVDIGSINLHLYRRKKHYLSLPSTVEILHLATHRRTRYATPTFSVESRSSVGCSGCS